MAAIYLKHPVHGEKVACGEGEAAADRANGWVDFDPTVKPEPVEPVVAEVVAPKAPTKAAKAEVPDFLKTLTKAETPKP